VDQGRSAVYGFIEPQTIQPSGNSHDHIKLYLQTWMVESNREIYFAQYIDAYVFFLVIFYEVILIISAKYLWLTVGIIGNYVSSFQDNARLYGFIYAIGRFHLLWKTCYKSKY